MTRDVARPKQGKTASFEGFVSFVVSECLRRHIAVILAPSRDHLRRHACLSLVKEQRIADASPPSPLHVSKSFA